MEIKPYAEKVSFDEFCERHGIQPVAHERSKHSGLARWYVTASRVEIRERGVLISEHGNGSTPEEAKRQYAELLAGHRLLLGGYDGVEVQAPNEWA